jgi:pimeloyl-ACP methyl ester carboxylesterase
LLEGSPAAARRSGRDDPRPGLRPAGPPESRAGALAALTLADLRGLTRLGFDATVGVTDLVEQLHRTIGDVALPLGRPRTKRTRGITGLVYRTIRGTTHLVARGVDASMQLLQPFASDAPAPVSSRREAALAAINGVWGHHLASSGNPLAIPMSLSVDGRRIELSAAGLRSALPAAASRIVVLVHGLCMNDQQWQRDGHHHGTMLARELGYSVLALRYNSGLHVSDNGERFAALLEDLVAHWPGRVEELAIVGHSMGGLVARSACQVAETRSLAWRTRLTRLVCLGTPHHGTALERGGHLIDRILGLSPYAAPFARVGKARSAGITDLRFGNVQHADCRGRHRHDQKHDDRTPTPLPAGVRVYFLAATTADRPRGLRHQIVGDGLVTLASAWGEHRDHALTLKLPSSHKAVITRANHWDLLSRPEVAERLRRWLA